MNAIVFCADGFEEIEALTVVDYLRRAEIDVKIVSVPSSTTKDKKIVTSSHNVSIISDLDFEEFINLFNNNLPDLIYFPGGMPGSTNLSNNKELLEFAEKCFDNNKYVSAICAAPAVVLGQTKILKNKKWTCYPEMQSFAKEEILKNSTHIKDVSFVTDDKLITGRGPGCAEQFAMELVKILCGTEKAEKIKKASIQR